jgi:hypothetical protein
LRCTLIVPRVEWWSSRCTAVQLECTLLLLGALTIYGWRCCRKSIQLIAHAWGWNLVRTPPLSYRRCRCALPSTHIWPQRGAGERARLYLRWGRVQALHSRTVPSLHVNRSTPVGLAVEAPLPEISANGLALLPASGGRAQLGSPLPGGGHRSRASRGRDGLDRLGRPPCRVPSVKRNRRGPWRLFIAVAVALAIPFVRVLPQRLMSQ